jgi:hypothetical protein
MLAKARAGAKKVNTKLKQRCWLRAALALP